MPIIISSQRDATTKERLIEENVEMVMSPLLAGYELESGTLSICEDRLYWNDTKTFISIDYQTIIIHAIAKDPITDTIPNVYCQLSSTTYIDDCGVPITGESCADDEEMPIELRIIPKDSGKVGQIYEIISECQKLNPDDIEDEGGWITSENVDSFLPNAEQQVFDLIG